VSYPRNAASPERVSIGAVVQISDGAVQTSGVAVKVIPFGGSEASGTGDVAYSADGVVLYTPVQSETDYTSFVLIASKAGCIPASTTVVTQASSTAGTVRVASVATDAIDAASLKTDAIAEIQNGLATPGDVSPTINFSPTIEPTELSAGSVSAIQSGLALESSVQSVITTLSEGVELDSATSGKIDSILQDTGTTLPAQIAGIEGGGGGGSATLEKQEEILAAIQGTEVIQVASPNVQGNLVLTQGDDYDGVANPRAQWNVTTDYTAGWTVRLTIRDADDAVVCTNTGSVVSATVVAVTIAAPTGLQMTGCPGQWQGKFDVELTHSTGKKKTIALGVCYINEDQTR
jgi:hypothetical protein